MHPEVAVRRRLSETDACAASGPSDGHRTESEREGPTHGMSGGAGGRGQSQGWSTARVHASHLRASSSLRASVLRRAGPFSSRYAPLGTAESSRTTEITSQSRGMSPAQDVPRCACSDRPAHQLREVFDGRPRLRSPTRRDRYRSWPISVRLGTAQGFRVAPQTLPKAWTNQLG